MASETRQPNQDETKKLAFTTVQTAQQNAIDFLMTERASPEVQADPELNRQYGHHINRLIEAKKWVGFLTFGALQDESQKSKAD